MDINSLLSDSNSQPGRSAQGSAPTPASGATTPSGLLSPHKPFRGPRMGSARQGGMTSSPLAQHVFVSNNLLDPSPPTPSPTLGPTIGRGSVTPPISDLSPVRQPSNPGMDALADLASMQHHQPQRSSGPVLLSTESYESQLSPSTMYPHVNPHARSTPTPRSSFDIGIPEGSKESTRRDFTDTSLAPDAQTIAMKLFTQIQENPHSYDAHVQFIGLLHAGFMNYVYPPDNPEARGNPREYDLLKDMRAAREEMYKLFALGEDLWAEWIQDESLLAQTVEERIAVLELCRRSVEEEYGSTKLWTVYGEWILYLYNAALGDADKGQWTEEDQQIGREVFTWQSIQDVWQRGAEETRWRINDSHVVWDQFLELQMQELNRAPSHSKISQVRGLFDIRLQTPHSTWDETFQKFSGFISKYCNADYEEIMSGTVLLASDTKDRYSARADFEHILREAEQSGDKAAEYAIYLQYVDWEVERNRKRRMFNPNLVAAVFQRAVLRFPTDVTIWESYVMFLIGESSDGHDNTTTIPTLERATRHCPWSGTLWAQYLLCSEREGASFTKIAGIKHNATRTGLLDAGGMEDVIKVHITWCGYLRRRAFQSESTDEDIDVAEVGIRSAIESVQKLGEKKYGQSYQGDPYFRLERIYIRYLSESGSWDSARETFKGLIDRCGGSYEFWLTYYQWELMSWSRFVRGEGTADAARRAPNPSYATAVLKQAIKRTDLDWPEKIVQAYINHCEDYEDSDELQLAVLKTSRAMKAVMARREREVAESAAQSALPDSPSVQQEKRKRETEEGSNGLPSTKRARAENSDQQSQAPSEPQRDRENSTIVVKNLTADTMERTVRQFFRHCGTIRALKMLPDTDGNSQAAIVEFETKDEAVVAQTRDQKILNGNAIKIQLGSGSTLFVTNFPPTADEGYLHDLFSKYGEIIDIRFPSLKYNTHRRFCYVQFRSPQESYNATELDGSIVSDKFRLVVKISDPNRKQERQGAMYEGREIHVSNIDFKANEDDLGKLFSNYGTVELVRIPRKADGGAKGFGFVVFSSKEEANAALAMHQQEFRSRPLQVRLASSQGPKKTATNIVSHVDLPTGINGAKNQNNWPEVPSGGRTARTLGLMNIPDIISSARIQSLAEQYGKLIKVVLRPDHQGAIIEYADVNDAGRAALELAGQEIAPGRRIRVGTVTEMLKQRAENRKRDMTSKQVPAVLQPTGPIRRPQQPGTRGRRGGLGMKRENTAMTRSRTDSVGDDPGNDHGGTGWEKRTRSNDDFRAMLQQQ